MSDMMGTKEVERRQRSIADQQEEHKHMYQAMCILASEDDCHTHHVLDVQLVEQ